MSKEMGVRISNMLEKRGMSQRQLAARIQISEQQLSRYITGDREPRPSTIANIATALQTTSDYILGLDDGDFNLNQVRRLIARNAANMTNEEKKELMNALFGEE